MALHALMARLKMAASKKFDRHTYRRTSCDVLSALTKEPAMALSRVLVPVLGLAAVVLMATQNINTRAQTQPAASNARSATTGNAATGEGLPNPAPVVIRNWGQLPAGRKWGTTA